MWRWARVPFTDTMLLFALIAAAAVPAFLVAAATHWERAAGDDFVARLVEEKSLADLGVSISVEAQFSGEAVVGDADARVREALETPELQQPIRSLTTARALGLVGGDLRPAGVPVRVLAHPFALEQLVPVAGERGATGGFWISEWFAGLSGLGVGDSLVLEASLEPDDPGAETAIGGGPMTTVDVVGVYRTLWSENGAPPPAFWRKVQPPGIIPTFISAFDEPGFALLITDEATLARSGITGSVRWDSELSAKPSTFADLSALSSLYAAIEQRIATDPATVAALEAQAPTALTIGFTSSVPDVLAEARSALGFLGQPVGSARAAGIVAGLTVMVGSGVLLVRRRSLEYRLMAGEGERWVRTSLRTIMQLAIPTVIGAVIGIAASALVAAMTFPESTIDVLALDWPQLIAVVLVGLALAALATGLAAQRTLDTGVLGRTRSPWPVLALSTVVTVYLWVQSGRSATRGLGAVDLTVVALPLAVLVTAVLVVAAALEAGGRLLRRGKARRLGPVVYLASRRITAEPLGGRLTVGALGVGIGLFVFSSLLAATMTHSGDVKADVEVGSASSLELLSHPPGDLELPSQSTLLAVQATTVSPGGGAVRVVAIDPDTFADAVAWPADFGSSADDVVALLGSEVGLGVPAVAVAGPSIPTIGSFGTFQDFPYEVVGLVDAVPFAAPTGATLLVSRDAIDSFELDRIAPGFTADTPGIDTIFFSPVRRFRPYLVSAQAPDPLLTWADANELVVRSTVTRAAVVDSVDAVATRVAFGYLQLLGLVGSLASAASIALYLAMRRRAAALSGILVRRMGLAGPRAALVTTIEVGLLGVMASIAAAAVAPLVTNRLVPRFDPLANLPPDIAVVIPALAVVAPLALIAAVVAVVWIGELLGSRRTPSEVLSGLD